MLKNIPGPEIRSPLLGNWTLLRDILRNQKNVKSREFIKLLNQLTKDYDINNCGMFRIWFGPFLPVVFITDANIAQKVLNSKKHMDKAKCYSLFRVATFDSVFTCKGNKWFRRKSEIQEHLKFKALNKYIANVEPHFSIFNERIENCIKKNDGVFEDIKPLISTFIIDLLGDNLFNTQFQAQASDKEPEFVLAVHKMLEQAFSNFLKPWTYSFRNKFLTRIISIPSIINSFSLVLKFRNDIRKIIIGRFKKIRFDESEEKSSMLDSLIKTRMKQCQLTKFQEIMPHISTLVIAGHDTTTSSLTWTLYLLGHHIAKQQRLMEEIDQFLYDLKINNEPITLLNLRRIKYLDSCIFESLRLYPSGPFIGRKANAPILLNDQITLPSDVDYFIFIQHMHLNPYYFKEPHLFYPERFMKNKDDPEHWVTYSAYLPFSGGLRMCLGKEYGMMQQRMFLINLLSKYSIQSLDQYGECKPKYDFLLSPAHFPIRFQRRCKTS